MRNRAIMRISFAAILLAPFLAAAAPAQSPLDGYIEEALSKNNSYLRAAIEVRKARAASDEARAMLLPRLSVQARATAIGGGYSTVAGDAIAEKFNSENEALNSILGRINPALALLPADSSYEGPARDLEAGATLSFPIFNAPAFLAFKARKQAIPLAEIDRSIAEANLVFQVKSGYYDYRRSRETAATLDRLLETVLERQRIAEALVASGKATEDAVYSAQVGLAELELKRAKAAQAVELSAARFNSLLGRRADEAIAEDALAASAPPPAASALPSREECVRAAIAGREELRRLDASRELLGTKARLARAAFLPTVGAQLDAGLRGEDLAFESNREYLNATVALKIDLFSGLQRSSARKQADDDLLALELLRAEGEDKIRLDATKAHGDALVASAAVESASRALELSEKSYAIAKAGFEAGSAGDIAFRQAESDLAQARLARLGAYYDYLASIAYLERATGLRIAGGSAMPRQIGEQL